MALPDCMQFDYAAAEPDRGTLETSCSTTPRGQQGLEDPSFYMYTFKVEACTNPLPHDWTLCPFSHRGERAARRDPCKYRYSGSACPDFRKGSCKRGLACCFAHGVFENHLHPSRYRTAVCKDGAQCQRPVCFFAHSVQQLRQPVLLQPSSAESSPHYSPASLAAAASLHLPMTNSSASLASTASPEVLHLLESSASKDDFLQGPVTPTQAPRRYGGGASFRQGDEHMLTGEELPAGFLPFGSPAAPLPQLPASSSSSALSPGSFSPTAAASYTRLAAAIHMAQGQSLLDPMSPGLGL